MNEASIFVIDASLKLSDSSLICLRSCAKSNCTGVLIQSEKCFNIVSSNYFGPINEQNYIEKKCVKKLSRNIMAIEWTDRILVDHSKKISKTSSKIECLALCANEKKFSCLSIMFYPDSNDCLLNSASSNSAPLKSSKDDNFPVFFMELYEIKDSSTINRSECVNAHRMMAFDEMEIRGETRLVDGSNGGLLKCLNQCGDCDFVVFNEIFSECFLVNYDPTGQMLDFINDEYQIVTSVCSTNRKKCTARNSMYISYTIEKSSQDLKTNCLEQCTMDENCHFAYQPSFNSTESECLMSRRRLSLPLISQRVCADIDDLPDGSAILFDELHTGCGSIDDLKSNSSKGMLVSKNVEVHKCMELCATHPTRSCEFIAYTTSRHCYLFNSPVVQKAPKHRNCSVFSLNVITFETGTQKKLPPSTFGESKPKNPFKAKTFSSGATKNVKKVDEKKLGIRKSDRHDPMDVKINTLCNFGDMTVKVTTKNFIDGEVYVRNGHTNCSTKIGEDGKAVLKIMHNSTRCPMIKNGTTYQAVVVVSQNIGNTTVITIDDQLFKVRCDYSNQKKVVAISKAMNLRTSTYSALDILGNVQVKPMSMELRAKRESVKAMTVSLGQKLDLIFNTQNLTKQVLVHRCLAADEKDDEKIILIEDGCATQHAKEYVLRGEVESTKTGFMLPFRAFRFKRGDAVKIECEIKFCDGKCQKPVCSLSRNRRFVVSGNNDEASDVVHAKILIRPNNSQQEDGGVCIKTWRFATISILILILLIVQLTVLLFFLFSRHWKMSAGDKKTEF